jgi:quinol monooxygenase YgiN
MYQVALRFVTPHEKRHEVLDVLQGLIGPTEVTKGCRRCQVFCDAGDEDAITYLLTWEEQADMEAYFRSEGFRQLLPYVELSPVPPLVEVSRLELVGGMECIVAAINPQPN